MGNTPEWSGKCSCLLWDTVSKRGDYDHVVVNNMLQFPLYKSLLSLQNMWGWRGHVCSTAVLWTDWPHIPIRSLPQVDLGLLRFVSGIGTQGAISKETKKEYYLKTYRVDVSSNGEDWITLKEGNKPVVSLFSFTSLCPRNRLLNSLVTICSK